MFHPDGPSFAELARQAMSSTRRGYDLLAPKFEVTPFRTPDWVLDAIAPALAASGKIERALDVCCGTGAGIRLLKPIASRDVVGIDFSTGMLAEAKERARGYAGRANVHLVQGDATRMPFREKFDLAVCFGALGHFVGGDQGHFLEAIHTALAPGGRFAFVTAGPVRPWTVGWWMARSFNAAMHVRNAVKKPPFIMFYLTFVLPDVNQLLESHGFAPAVVPVTFPAPWQRLKLVIATKR